MKWWEMEPWVGFDRVWYTGTPISTYVSVWGAPVFVAGRGKFADIRPDPATGAWVLNGVRDLRTASYSQSDLNFVHEMHVSKDNETLKLGFELNVSNVLNQRSPTFVEQNLIRSGSINRPRLADGSPDYKALLTGYDYLANAKATNKIFDSREGLTYGFQNPRALRVKARVVF